MKMLRRALEEAATGEIVKEIEVVLYADLVDMSELLKAYSKEHHEQWQIDIPHSPGNAASGKSRVRKTIPNITEETAVYTNTTKIATHNKEIRLEVTIPSTEDNFRQYQLLADVGMLKDRYSFKIPNTELILEVDMFYLPGAAVGSGRYSTKCKIDIELPDVHTSVPELPILFTNIIRDDDNTPPEVRKEIDEIFKNVFLTKNIHLHT